MNLQINPKFRDLIPPLSEDEYAGLEESIIKEGCRDSIIIWNETIIDGHNRYNICTERSIPFDTSTMEFESEPDAEIWIIKNQFGRRNINAAIRSILASRLEPLLAAKAKENQQGGQGGKLLLSTLSKAVEPINTRKEVAKLAGVSEGTYDKVKKVMKSGTEEVKQKMQSGEISINKAFNESTPDKTCTICGNTLPSSEFYQNKAQCKKCLNAKKREPVSKIDESLRLQPYRADAAIITVTYTEEQEECLDISKDYYCHTSDFAMTPRMFEGLTKESGLYEVLTKVSRNIDKILKFIEGDN